MIKSTAWWRWGKLALSSPASFSPTTAVFLVVMVCLKFACTAQEMATQTVYSVKAQSSGLQINSIDSLPVSCLPPFCLMALFKNSLSPDS